MSRYDEYDSSNDDLDTATDDSTDSVFDDSGDETDITDYNDLDSLSESSDDDVASLFDDEEQHPPDYYRDGAANLDLKRLRQKRYAPKTQARLNWVKEHCIRYCAFMKEDLAHCFREVNPLFLHGFFSWVCDQRRGKGGRRRPGIRHTSSLHTFWKWYLLVYKLEVGEKMGDMNQIQGLDVMRIVAIEKKLDNTKRESATMYVNDLTDFARVLLATTHMYFAIGWLRIQLILFCQLASITGNRPEALTNLRYRHFQLTLIRDPCGSRPRLVIELTAEYTKTYLGSKDANCFPIPEIIFDPTLVLSPHVFFLGMLFKIQAFKSPGITCPEKLYSLNVLNGLNEQKLPLREELDDKFIFCNAVYEAYGVRIALEQQATTDWFRYRMKKGGEITGMEEVTKPYCLRDGNAKSLNDSPYISDSMQCLILQHGSIDTFLKHYLDHRINVDLARVYRHMKPEEELMELLCSMRRSIDPRRPWKLTKEQSASINNLPCIIKLDQRAKKLSKASKVNRCREKHKTGVHRYTLTGRIEKASTKQKEREKKGKHAQAVKCLTSEKQRQKRLEKHDQAVKLLASEKQRQKRLLLKDIRDRYKKEQPVKDSERQLSGNGNLVDDEVRSALEQSESMTPEHLHLINAIMTLPETTEEKELQRRIRGINAVITYCGIEERRSYSGARPGRPARNISPAIVNADEQRRSEEEMTLSYAIASVKTDKRPRVCFLCIGNPQLPMYERVKVYATVGSLSRHFKTRHVNRLQEEQQIDCRICDLKIEHRMHLLNHAETSHGTVVRA